MKILLIVDETLNVDIDNLVLLLNSKSEYVDYTGYEKSFSFDKNIIYFPSAHSQLALYLGEEIKLHDKIFYFTETPYDNDYFYMECLTREGFADINIYSFSGWEFLTQLPVINGIVYFIAVYLAIQLDPTEFRHMEKNTGCIFDFNIEKKGIDANIKQACYCPSCFARISNLESVGEKRLFKDISNLLNILSDSFRWNKDILLQLDNSAILQKKSTRKKGEVHLVVASPGDTEQEREILDKLEGYFRKYLHEKHCGHRLIVHRWEDLAPQVGVPQDIINKNIIKDIDIVLAIFRHKLGTPVIDPVTNEIRSESGTAEELSFALDGNNPNRPEGMMYCYSEVPDIKMDNRDRDRIIEEWDRLQGYKNKVKNKLIYKEYNDPEDLLSLVSKDIETLICANYEMCGMGVNK